MTIGSKSQTAEIRASAVIIYSIWTMICTLTAKMPIKAAGADLGFHAAAKRESKTNACNVETRYSAHDGAWRGSDGAIMLWFVAIRDIEEG
jgi:hypothetical protein